MASLDLSLFEGLRGPASRSDLVRILLDHDHYAYIEGEESVLAQNLVMVVHRRAGGDVFRLTYAHGSDAAGPWTLVDAVQYVGLLYR